MRSKVQGYCLIQKIKFGSLKSPCKNSRLLISDVMFSSGKPSWTKRGCKRAVNGNTTWRMREDVHQSAGMAWRSRIECWASNIKISRNTWSTTAHPFLPDPRKYLVIYSLPSGSVYINRINSFLISILWAPWSKARLQSIGDVACVRHWTFIHKD